MSNSNKSYARSIAWGTSNEEKIARMPDGHSQQFRARVKGRATVSNQIRRVLGQQGTAQALVRCQSSVFHVRNRDSENLETPKEHGMRNQASMPIWPDNLSANEAVARVPALRRSSSVSHEGD